MRRAECAKRDSVPAKSAVLIMCVLVVSLCAAFPEFSAAADKPLRPRVIIAPKKVGPGDIMTVTVKGGKAPVEGTFDAKPIHFNKMKNGFVAIVGIDLYSKPGKYRLAMTTAGKKRVRTVTVSRKTYPIQRLTLPEDMVTLSPENAARVERESRLLSAIWPAESTRLWSGSFIDPLPGKELGTPFGVRRIINKIPKNSHSGIDVSADEGDPIVAPNDGVVVLVDDQFFSGNSVILDHGQGIYTMFFHLSKIEVRNGQAVMKGDVIARVGSTGRATGAHLHWGVRVQGARVDPMDLIRLKLD